MTTTEKHQTDHHSILELEEREEQEQKILSMEGTYVRKADSKDTIQVVMEGDSKSVTIYLSEVFLQVRLILLSPPAGGHSLLA